MGIVKGYICTFSSKYGNFWLEATNSKAEASKHTESQIILSGHIKTLLI